VPSVAVLIPWRPVDEHRDAALLWVRRKYAVEHPDWQILVSFGPTPWSKAPPVMAAARATAAEIVVVSDADVWCNRLPDAVQSVANGAAWAIPHWLVKRLTLQATRETIAGRHIEDLDEPGYPGMPGGGLTVLPRTALLDIPLDPRFIGWGQEDESWSWALTTLLGPPERHDGDLIHLWHPPQPRLTRARGNPEGWRLRRRYARARHDPALMRSLLEEAQLALSTAEPALHGPPAVLQRIDDTVRPAA
jgi:hypothetical protein